MSVYSTLDSLYYIEHFACVDFTEFLFLHHPFNQTGLGFTRYTWSRSRSQCVMVSFNKPVAGTDDDDDEEAVDAAVDKTGHPRDAGACDVDDDDSVTRHAHRHQLRHVSCGNVPGSAGLMFSRASVPPRFAERSFYREVAVFTKAKHRDGDVDVASLASH